MRKILEDNIGNRKIVFWGSSLYNNNQCKTFNYWEKNLKNEHYEVAFCVDSDMDKCIGNVKFHYELNGCNDKFYVIVLCAYYDEIYRLLEKYGYREHTDFIYIRHQPVVVNSTCDYSDKYNNVLEGRLPEGGRIIFSGYNAHVVIGKNIKFNGTIEVRNNSRFIIGDNVTIENANPWLVANEAVCEVGANCKFKKTGLVNVLDNAEFYIGDGSTFENNYHMSIQEGTTCRFGNDCMASNDLIVRTNDGHTIFDNEKKANVNTVPEIRSKRQIILGKHVWVGQRCALLYNTKIGDNTIVGMGSVVKGNFDGNCMIAGVPAKIIKRNISWSRKKVGNYDEEYGQNS